MSEIAKCPMCGETPRVKQWTYEDDDVSIYCCGVTVDGGSKPWNQYAVAMELARVTACDCTESARTHAMAAYIKEFR